MSGASTPLGQTVPSYGYSSFRPGSAVGGPASAVAVSGSTGPPMPSPPTPPQPPAPASAAVPPSGEAPFCCTCSCTVMGVEAVRPPQRAVTTPGPAPSPLAVNWPDALREPRSARSTVKVALTDTPPLVAVNWTCGSGRPGSTTTDGAKGAIWRSVATAPSGPRLPSDLPPSAEPLASVSVEE